MKNVYIYKIIKKDHFIIDEIISNKDVDFSSENLSLTINKIQADFKKINKEIETSLYEVLTEITYKIPTKIQFFEKKLKNIVELINEQIQRSFSRKINVINNFFDINIISVQDKIEKTDIKSCLNISINRIPFLPFNEEHFFKENKKVYIFNEENNNFTLGYIKYTTVKYIKNKLEVIYEIFDKKEDYHLFDMSYEDLQITRNNVKGKILSAILDKEDALNYVREDKNNIQNNIERVFEHE